MIRLFILAALLLANNFSYGAWYVQEGGYSTERVKVSDAEYELSYKSISCKLSATVFSRQPNNNDSILEYRTLSCKVSIDTEVEHTVGCHLPRWESGSLTIKKSGVYFVPMFLCGPNK